VRIKEKWLLLVFVFAFLLLGMNKEARKNELLFSFENEEELKFISGAPHQISQEHATKGSKTLKIELSPENPSITLTAQGKTFDFQGFDELMLDVYREGKPITLNLRILDQAGNRYNCWYYLLRPGLFGVKGQLLYLGNDAENREGDKGINPHSYRTG
jgi:hypothetical protein